MSTTSQISSLATRIGQEVKALWAAVNAKAPTNNPTLTGTVTLPSTTSIGNVSSTELGYVDGVTSGVQEQLNGKANTSHGHAIADTTGLQTALAAAAPAGSLMAFAGDTAPDGWLLCYGQAVSRTTYAALFAVIGTTYGAGVGSTTFNLPDLRGRVIAGLDNMGGAASAFRIGGMTDGLGQTGGSAVHRLTENEIPSHRHDAGDIDSYLLVNQGGAYEMTGSTGAPRTHYTGYTGGGATHNNMQPTMLLNWIIKT